MISATGSCEFSGVSEVISLLAGAFFFSMVRALCVSNEGVGQTWDDKCLGISGVGFDLLNVQVQEVWPGVVIKVVGLILLGVLVKEVWGVGDVIKVVVVLGLACGVVGCTGVIFLLKVWRGGNLVSGNMSTSRSDGVVRLCVWSAAMGAAGATTGA